MIQVVGAVKDLGLGGEFVLDDGSGTINVRDIPDETDPINQDLCYRVMGKFAIDPTGSAYLAAQIIQPLPQLNLELYKKSLELLKKIN